jgi:tryptophan-rich sensory protein
MPPIRTILVFLFVVFTPLVLGSILGALFPAGKWYNTLNKPSFSPPPIAFAIVWPFLYVFMGLAAYLALVGQKWYFWVFYVAQLITNLLFSPLTFGAHNLLAGAILTLLTFLLATITTLQYSFALRKITSTVLMLPYLAWLAFATVLAWTVYYMNK